MNKKMVCLLLAGLFCLGVYGNAFAAWTYSFDEEGSLSFTKGENGVNSDTFGEGETPWMHISINKSYFNYNTDTIPSVGSLNVMQHLSFGSDRKHHGFGISGATGYGSWDGENYKFSTPLSDWGWDNSLKGEWNFAWVGFDNEVSAGGMGSLYATPEPISCVLFLLGGGSLAFSRFRKRFVKI